MNRNPTKKSLEEKSTFIVKHRPEETRLVFVSLSSIVPYRDVPKTKDCHPVAQFVELFLSLQFGPMDDLLLIFLSYETIYG